MLYQCHSTDNVTAPVTAPLPACLNPLFSLDQADMIISSSKTLTPSVRFSPHRWARRAVHAFLDYTQAAPALHHGGNRPGRRGRRKLSVAFVAHKECVAVGVERRKKE